MAGPALPARRVVSGEHGRGPGAQHLLALWAAAVVLFNFPVLIIWNQDVTILGLPLLPVALFTIWAVLIAVLAWASERSG